MQIAIRFPNPGRPRCRVDVQRVIALRVKGLSWRRIAKRLGVGVGTVHRAAVSLQQSHEKSVKNPRYEFSQRAFFRWLYQELGVTKEQWDAMVAEQEGKCRICGLPAMETTRGRLTMDHDHVTGLPRSPICHNCNLGLGHFLDSPEIMRRAAEYIEFHLRAHGAVQKRSKT